MGLLKGTNVGGVNQITLDNAPVQLKNLIPGTEANDAATVSQLTGGGLDPVFDDVSADSVAVTGTTDSTSGSTGSINTAGGIGATKDIYSAAGITAATQMRVSATTNQIRLGNISAFDTIISSTAPAADRVYTIPDAGGNVEFVMAGGTQSIAGAKTFTTAPLFQNRVVNQSADGVITPSASNITYYVTKAGVCAMTIANPTATTHDGARLTFISTTAQAHTLSNAAGAGFNAGGAGGDVGTFGGAIGDNIVIEAYQGVWYVVSKVNVTLG